MLAAAAMPLLCGAMLRTHFDLFPVALLLGGLLLLCRDRPRAGLALLGLAGDDEAASRSWPSRWPSAGCSARGRRREAWQGGAGAARR